MLACAATVDAKKGLHMAAPFAKSDLREGIKRAQ
jgi:hypothetical protein